MTARADMVDRIERALADHEPARAFRNDDGDPVIVCKCQPRDGAPILRAEWRRHVAEQCVAKALRIY
jgi:hypothetical protein